MPELVGLPSTVASRRLGRVPGRERLDVSWAGPVTVRCEVRPGAVAAQRPAAGARLWAGRDVVVRTAAIDLRAFRGPCEPGDGDLGPLGGPDAALARQLYRFAADPGLGAPFVDGDVWVGIENGLVASTVAPDDRSDLGAWVLRTSYAERIGPFSALDLLALSGGYYELRRGVERGCAFDDGPRPPALAELRAITLSAPADVVESCMEWWAVTLFLDDADRIAGVALRLGAP